MANAFCWRSNTFPVSALLEWLDSGCGGDGPMGGRLWKGVWGVKRVYRGKIKWWCVSGVWSEFFWFAVVCYTGLRGLVLLRDDGVLVASLGCSGLAKHGGNMTGFIAKWFGSSRQLQGKGLVKPGGSRAAG